MSNQGHSTLKKNSRHGTSSINVLSASDICSIIRECKKSGVLHLSFNELVVDFTKKEARTEKAINNLPEIWGGGNVPDWKLVGWELTETTVTFYNNNGDTLSEIPRKALEDFWKWYNKEQKATH